MKKLNKKYNSGFVLIELLVVIAIIGVVSSLAMVGLAQARMQSRDSRRLADMHQIQTALEIYLSTYGTYPTGASELMANYACWGLDTTIYPPFLPELTGVGLIGKDPADPYPGPSYCDNNGPWFYYQYMLYPAGSRGCDPRRGRFYVLALGDMENVPVYPVPSSPGWKCTGNWGTGGVVGAPDSGPLDWGTYGHPWLAGSYEK